MAESFMTALERAAGRAVAHNPVDPLYATVEDQAKVRVDLMLYGEATIRLDENGNMRHVPVDGDHPNWIHRTETGFAA